MFKLVFHKDTKSLAYRATSSDVPPPRIKLIKNDVIEYIPLEESEPKLHTLNIRKNGNVFTPAGPITDGLICWLDGRDGNNEDRTSVWVDRSGNGNHATLHNFSFDSTSGWVSGGLQTNGTNNYARVPNIAMNKDEFSIIVEYKVTNAKTGEYCPINLIRKVDESNSNFFFMSHARTGHPNKICFDVKLHGIRAVNEEFDNHIVVTFSKSQNIYKIYMNGTLVYSSVIEETATNTTSSDLYIGSSRTLDRYAQCLFKSARVYNRALTEAEIKHNYDYDNLTSGGDVDGF